MKVSQNFLFYLGVALLFLTLGVILAFGAIYFTGRGLPFEPKRNELSLYRSQSSRAWL